MRNERVAALLDDLDVALRRLANDAIARGEYAIASSATRTLQCTAELSSHLRGDMEETIPGGPRQGVPDRTPSAIRSKALTADSNARSQYPVYAREDDHVVKIGWSSKNDEEYLHRAPRASIAATCSRISSVAREKSRLTREDIGLVEAPDQEAVPDYQIYVVLGWLRWAGLVRRHGRRGYSIPNPRDFDRSWRSAFDQLPSVAQARS